MLGKSFIREDIQKLFSVLSVFHAFIESLLGCDQLQLIRCVAKYGRLHELSSIKELTNCTLELADIAEDFREFHLVTCRVQVWLINAADKLWISHFLNQIFQEVWNVVRWQ